LAACNSTPSGKGANSVPAADAKASTVAAKEKSPGEILDAYIQIRSKAFAARDQGRGGDGLDLANSALELFPDSSDILWVKVWAYRQLGSPEKARSLAERLIKDGDLGLRDHYHDLGDMYSFDLNDPKTGIEWYGKQISRDPENSGWSYHQRGYHFMVLGEYVKARADLGKAQAIASYQNDQNLLNSAKDNLKQLDAKEAGK
jgi:tetratricopeptide (TPR) repeat protein